jgi:RHS repeat-associated protein
VTIFVYDGSGLLAEEYSTTVVPVEQAKVSYLTTDHLGSPRVITDQNGAVISRKDFTAFGEEVTSSQRVGGTNGNGYDPPNVRQDYTGYQKDNESGLEFAQARYYNTGHGRFTSVDPLTASATIRNPQTFNRYSYVLNSPYEFVDPLGLAHCNTGRCVQVGGGDWFTSTYDGVTPQFSRARSQTRTSTVTGSAVRNLEEQARRDIARRLPLLFGDGIPEAPDSPMVDRDSTNPEWSAQNLALTRTFTDGAGFARANRTGENGPRAFFNGGPTHYRLSTGEIIGIHVYGDEFGLTAPNIFIPDGFDRLTDIRPTWLGILNSKTKEFIVAFHIKGVRSNAQFQANRRFHNAAGSRFIGVGGGPGGNTPGNIHSCIKIFKDAASGREYVRQINLATFDFDARRYGDLRKYLR